MKKTLLSTLGLALAVTSVLLGCTDPETKSKVEARIEETHHGLQQATQPAIPPKQYNPLVVSNKVWAGGTALHMTQGMPLPEKFESLHGVTVVSSEPMTISDILQSVQQQTGIVIHFADAGVRARVGGAGAAASGGADAPASMPIAYEGPLSGLLDRLVSYFGLSWRFDGSTIYVTRYETRVFAIEALPGSQQVSDGMQDDSSGGSSGGASGGSSGGSSGGGSQTSSVTQNSKFTIDIKYWEELEKVIVSMLGGVGNAVVSPSLGTVTVTTSPRNMQLIADYLAQENQRISRQIAVNIEIYSVTLTKGMDFDVAFNTALRRLTNFGGNFTGASAPATVSGFSGGGMLSLAVLNPNVIHFGDGTDITRPTGEITDIFTALSGIGNTTQVAKFPLITLNNRPVSRRVGQDISYVASATSSTNSTGGSSTILGGSGTTLTPGTVHQGFSVQLTPRLLDDGRILLQYSLSIIDVVSITSFNSVTGTDASATASSSAVLGSSTVQLPTTSNKIFVQQAVLKSGSTLFLGGAEQEDAKQNSQGVGDPEFYALGGGLSSGTSHTMVFFAITPQVLDTPHSEQE